MSSHGEPGEALHRLQEQVDALSDQVHSLSVAVVYDPAEPLEAFHARYAITGTTRAAAMLVSSAVLARANGQPPAPVSQPDLLTAHPVIARAQQPGPIDLAEAVTVLGEVVGTQARAVEYLLAHRARGLSAPGTDYLGL